MNVTVYDPIYHVDAYIPPGENPRPEHAQAAVDDAIAHGGGIVEFGARKDYQIRNLRVEFDARLSVVTLRGQGVGHRAGSSPTVLNVPAGATGIELAHTTGDAATFHVENLEVRGGDIGIHLPNNPAGWCKGNTVRDVALRDQTRAGLWVQHQVFNGLYQGILVIMVQNPDNDGSGILTENHQNACAFRDIEVRQCGHGGIVIDTNADGSGFNSSITHLLAEANYGPGLRAQCTGVDMPHATQINGLALIDSYFEANGMTSGEADIVTEGHLHDAILHMTRFGPPSQAQRDNPAGPLMLDVRGVARKVDILVFTGGKAVNVGGQRVLGTNHSGVLRLSFHDDVRSVGRQITRDDYIYHYQRVSVNDAGQMTLDDVNAAMLS